LRFCQNCQAENLSPDVEKCPFPAPHPAWLIVGVFAISLPHIFAPVTGETVRFAAPFASLRTCPEPLRTRTDLLRASPASFGTRTGPQLPCPERLRRCPEGLWTMFRRPGTAPARRGTMFPSLGARFPGFGTWTEALRPCLKRLATCPEPGSFRLKAPSAPIFQHPTRDNNNNNLTKE
jgi:hypothetical protein